MRTIEKLELRLIVVNQLFYNDIFENRNTCIILRWFDLIQVPVDFTFHNHS